MTYRVVWRSQLTNRLHVLAFLSSERGDRTGAIPRAIEEIELRLALAPLDEGESREGSERVLVVLPLCVTYEVFESEETGLIYESILYPGRPV